VSFNENPSRIEELLQEVCDELRKQRDGSLVSNYSTKMKQKNRPRVSFFDHLIYFT
jgi:hypothetical protein